MNPVDQITESLADRIGLRSEISKPKILDLLEKTGDSGLAGILSLLERPLSSPEWLKFVAPFLIHETYFFRHAPQLQFLLEHVLPKLIQERAQKKQFVFRVWCAGCSSGEEAYSVGLLLRDALARTLPHEKTNTEASSWHVQIIGTDLSPSMIQRARTGEYRAASGLNSFRDIPPFARHHFPNIPHNPDPSVCWSPDAALRKSVSFQQANLLHDPAPAHDLDLILCRNLLIYFNDSKARSVIAKFKNALRSGGALLLGPADSIRETESFDCISNDRVIVWKKKGGSTP